MSDVLSMGDIVRRVESLEEDRAKWKAEAEELRAEIQKQEQSRVQEQLDATIAQETLKGEVRMELLEMFQEFKDSVSRQLEKMQEAEGRMSSTLREVQQQVETASLPGSPGGTLRRNSSASGLQRRGSFSGGNPTSPGGATSPVSDSRLEKLRSDLHARMAVWNEEMSRRIAEAERGIDLVSSKNSQLATELEVFAGNTSRSLNEEEKARSESLGHLESLIRKEQAERELEIAESKRTVEGNCKAIETNRKVLEAALKVVVDNQKNVDARLSSELEALHQSISRQKKRIKAMEESSKALLAEYDGSHNMKLQENESKYSTLVVALQEVDRQIRGLDENLALLQGKTAEQRTALTETTVEIFARLDTQLSDLKSQGEETADLQTKLAEQDTDLQELRNRMVTQQELLSKTREELESSIQSHSESAEVVAAQLSSIKAKGKARVAAVKEVLENLEKKLSDVKETEEAKREKLRTDLQERMEVLSQDLGDLEGAHQELAERVSEENLNELRDGILEVVSREIADIKSIYTPVRLEVIEQDIATTVSDVNTLKVRADDIVTDFESLRDRLQRLGSLIDENDVNIREDLDHLQHDLEGLITSVRSDAALRMDDIEKASDERRDAVDFLLSRLEAVDNTLARHEIFNGRTEELLQGESDRIQQVDKVLTDLRRRCINMIDGIMMDWYPITDVDDEVDVAMVETLRALRFPVRFNFSRISPKASLLDKRVQTTAANGKAMVRTGGGFKPLWDYIRESVIPSIYGAEKFLPPAARGPGARASEAAGGAIRTRTMSVRAPSSGGGSSASGSPTRKANNAGGNSSPLARPRSSTTMPHSGSVGVSRKDVDGDASGLPTTTIDLENFVNEHHAAQTDGGVDGSEGGVPSATIDFSSVLSSESS